MLLKFKEYGKLLNEDNPHNIIVFFHHVATEWDLIIVSFLKRSQNK